MFGDTLSKIEQRIQSSPAFNQESREELLKLLATLKGEISDLSKTHREQAQSIAGFTEVSAHEATRQTRNPELLDLSVKGLASSVSEFEKTHPELVGVVNRICTALANMGI